MPREGGNNQALPLILSLDLAQYPQTNQTICDAREVSIVTESMRRAAGRPRSMFLRKRYCSRPHPRTDRCAPDATVSAFVREAKLNPSGRVGTTDCNGAAGILRGIDRIRTSSGASLIASQFTRHPDKIPRVASPAATRGAKKNHHPFFPSQISRFLLYHGFIPLLPPPHGACSRLEREKRREFASKRGGKVASRDPTLPRPRPIERHVADRGRAGFSRITHRGAGHGRRHAPGTDRERSPRGETKRDLSRCDANRRVANGCRRHSRVQDGHWTPHGHRPAGLRRRGARGVWSRH